MKKPDIVELKSMPPFPYTYEEIMEVVRSDEFVGKIAVPADNDDYDEFGENVRAHEVIMDLRTNGAPNASAHGSRMSRNDEFVWIDMIHDYFPKIIEWAEKLPYDRLNTMILHHVDIAVPAHSDLFDMRLDKMDIYRYAKHNRGKSYHSIKVLLLGGNFYVGSSKFSEVREGEPPKIYAINDFAEHYATGGEDLCIISLGGFLGHIDEIGE